MMMLPQGLMQVFGSEALTEEEDVDYQGVGTEGHTSDLLAWALFLFVLLRCKQAVSVCSGCRDRVSKQ